MTWPLSSRAVRRRERAGRLALMWVAASLVGAIVAATPLRPAYAQNTDPPAAMILLDGSGSMWARLDGDSRQAKFYLARDAVKSALPAFKTSFRLGFASFGHRRQGDCSDVHAPLPPANGDDDRDRLIALLDRHNPRGKSPLTAGMKEAVKALPKGSGPRSLIIIHDDLDNCSQDPCTALADLRAMQPGLVIHAIGLGLKGDDAQRLQCLVKPTGGRLIDVQAANAVAAAVGEIFKLTAAGPLPPAPRPAAVRPNAQPPTAPAVTDLRPQSASLTGQGTQRRPLRKDGAPALRVATLLASGQMPLPRDVEWTIRPATGTATVLEATGQDITIPLAPGAYKVEVRDGLLTPRKVDVIVGPTGETALDVTLNAAIVRASFPAAAMAAGRIQLFEGDQTKPVGLMSATDLAAGIALRPGPWIARFSEGLASKDIPFEARAGAATDLGATWPFASLTLRLAEPIDDARHPTTVIIYEDDPDAPRGQREVTRGLIGGTLTVPSGTYAIAVRQGYIETRNRIVMTPGARVERTITLPMARLSLTSRLPGTGAGPNADANEPVAFRLERVNVVPPEVFTANRRQSTLTLPPGRYRIEARHGLINARAMQEITLEAGKRQTLVLEPSAGLLRLAAPPGVSDVLWEVLDEAGYPLWSTAQLAPIATLQAGRYTVRLDHRGNRQEWRVDLRPGELRQLDARP